MRAAATRSGAAEEKSPGTMTSPSRSAPAGSTVTEVVRRRMRTQPDAVDEQLVVGHVLDLHAERANRAHGRLRVARAAEAEHARLPLPDRAEQDGAVGDRLVAGDRDVADDRGGRLDAHGSADRA